MNSFREAKQKHIWDRIIEDMIQEAIPKEHFLNYPVERAFSDLWRTTRDLFDRLENIDWEEELKNFSREPFSKTAILTVANIGIFSWLLFSGTIAQLTPDYLDIYVPSAFGAQEENGNLASKGLLPEEENQGVLSKATEVEGNSIAETGCEKSKEEGRCSELCADLGGEKSLISQIRANELRIFEEKIIKKGASKVSKVIRRVGALMPRVFAMKSGRMVCNKKNDHPSKSKTNKKGHMDMECCLDPDEIPNPNCYYSLEKYGKYLR